MSPRLPLCTIEELEHELDLIAWDRQRLDGRIVSQAKRDNYLASLNEWEQDIREQLEELRHTAEAAQATKGKGS